MDKNNFKKAMDTLRNYQEFIYSLYTQHRIDVFNNEPLNNLESCYVDVLKDAMKDTSGDIDYFIYDLNWGKEYAPGCVTENEVDLDFSSVDALYDYLSNK